MLNLRNFEATFSVVSLISALPIASPALVFVFPLPNSEQFSELYVLGADHMAEDYPLNVKANETYKILIGVGNHMGLSTYYILYVKLRNQSEPLPNSTAATPSPLPDLYEYRILLRSGEVWKVPLNFPFGDISVSVNNCFIDSLTVNGLALCQ